MSNNKKQTDISNFTGLNWSMIFLCAVFYSSALLSFTIGQIPLGILAFGLAVISSVLCSFIKWRSAEPGNRACRGPVATVDTDRSKRSSTYSKNRTAQTGAGMTSQSKTMGYQIAKAGKTAKKMSRLGETFKEKLGQFESATHNDDEEALRQMILPLAQSVSNGFEFHEYTIALDTAWLLLDVEKTVQVDEFLINFSKEIRSKLMKRELDDPSTLSWSEIATAVYMTARLS